MIDGWVIITCSLLYIGALFGIAYLGDRAGRKGPAPFGRPYVYALALGVYCTSWTFFGSVGSASEKGFDFIAVYFGPIIAFTLALPVLRRIRRLTKEQNITSIADFIAARYGKNPAVAAIVTIVAVVGVLPYIALQLKAISQAIAVLLGHSAQGASAVMLPIGDLDLVIAIVLATFTILFGARHSDATEHQRGLMLAVAVESIVKLTAFILVGIYVVYGMNEGPSNLIATAMTQTDAYLFNTGIHGGTLLTVSFLSFVCIILLPRQFHVTFVENVSEEELNKASWLFPLYLIAINIFVVPVAMAGSLMLGNTYPHDMYLLALPLHAKSQVFTFIAFLGGLSAATAMVVVETVALSIMLCNDLLMPLILKRPAMTTAGRRQQDMSGFLLNIRRGTMLAIILAAYAFYDKIGNASLSEIGLLSFAAIAQFAPAFFIGLFWRRATARGAAAGILAGFAVWAYTLLLPRLIGDTAIGAAFLRDGPFGIAFLRPEMLFYLNFDHLTHGVVWSLTINVIAFLFVSLLRPLEPIERLQTNLFIEDANPHLSPAFKPWRTSVPFDELMATVARYLGEERTSRSFADYMVSRGINPSSSGQADPHAVKFTENLLASAIGAPSSRLVMSLMLRRLNLGRDSALRLLDEASEAVQYNRDLLQCALDHVGQGIAVFDKKMQLICWNRQYREILMLPQQYARVGTPLDEIIRFKARRVHKDPAAVEEFVTDRIVKYQLTERGFHECTMDSRVIEVRVNAMPQGGVVVTYTDITERQAASEALARANENLERRVEARTLELAIAKAKADEANISKTRFLAAASHDVLQPLNAARLYASSLLERSPPAELGRLARNIDASLDGVEEILNALLDISRLDSGAMKPEFGVFPVKDLLEQITIDFEPIAKARGIAFTIVPSSALIRSDRKLLRRILQNLVSNALKYNKDKGRVVLGCRRRGRNLIIEVHDSGPGIADDQRDVIFKEFQRLENHGHAPGLGLGLSIVERMCRVLDHRLSLESKLGTGSSFSVWVPLARWSEMEQPRTFATRPVSYGDLRGAIVLCVDNDRSIIDGMKALLSSWQCPVIAAMDSAEAVEQVKAARVTPDIIISDYHLDREDGCEAIRAITAACNADIPGIIATADNSQEVRTQVLEAGHAFLQKPIKPAALRALISSLIIQRQAAE